MFKAFSYVFAFALICLIGIFAWLSFTNVPVDQQLIEQQIQLPAQS